MIRLTNSAQSALNHEITNYKEFIIDRASGYASQDESIEINNRHIRKAVRDYRNDFYTESRERVVSKKRRLFFSITMLVAILSSILFAFIFFFFTEKRMLERNTDETVMVLSIFGLLITMILIVTMYITMIKLRRKEMDGDNRKKIVEFLNKWNELESLLRNLYKKVNHKEAGTFKELLAFYTGIPAIQEKNKKSSISTLLNARNNLIHRGIKNVNVKTIEGFNDELDMIIGLLKTTNRANQSPEVYD